MNRQENKAYVSVKISRARMAVEDNPPEEFNSVHPTISEGIHYMQNLSEEAQENYAHILYSVGVTSQEKIELGRTD